MRLPHWSRVRSDRTGGVGATTVPDLIAAWAAGDSRHSRRAAADRNVRAPSVAAERRRRDRVAGNTSDEVPDEVPDEVSDKGPDKGLDKVLCPPRK